MRHATTVFLLTGNGIMAAWSFLAALDEQEVAGVHALRCSARWSSVSSGGSGGVAGS